MLKGSGEKLSSTELRSELTVIEEEAFSWCNSLRTIELPEGLAEIGPRVFRESGLEGINIPSSVRIICEGIFYHCKNLWNVEFSEGLNTIEKSAF